MSQIDYPTVTTIYPFGEDITIPQAAQQHGSVTGVAADGSAESAIVFPLPFSQTIPLVFVSLSDVSDIASYALTVQTDGESLTGFNVYVAGGPAGSTCTVVWQTQGGL